MSEPAAGPRERYRQQVRAEVQELAWVQIAEAGASALSLKAIAKQLGMTAPALYRYFASRDDLLTGLILSAYRELAELVESIANGVDPPAARLAAIAQEVRAWAIGAPHRYLLLYGTPVPGYHAPAEATALAVRIFAPILAGFGADFAEPDSGGIDPGLRQALTFWTRMHGVVSLEVAGHFTGMPFDPAELYAVEIDSLVGNLIDHPPLGLPQVDTQG
jgi:AcrR family transcriptional regulator